MPKVPHFVAANDNEVIAVQPVRIVQSEAIRAGERCEGFQELARLRCIKRIIRSEEHTSELQSLMRISYAVFCLKKKKLHTTKFRKHQIHHRKQISNN